MKTLKLNLSQLTGTISSFIMFSAAVVLFTGCQKDAMPTVSSNDQNQSSVERIKPTAQSFTIIVIDHSSARTELPSYKVEIKANGDGMFDGRKNTAFIGSKEFHVSSAMMQEIKNMFIESKFSEIESMTFANDLPIVSTSFRMDNASEFITKLDYTQSDKASRLIELRTNIEEMLGISQFVNSKRNINDSQLSMEHLQD